jgi:hypothetical protein
VATSTIVLPVGAATLPDGSSGNAAPAMERVQGTESNPKKHVLAARFDAATEEFLYWAFRMPADYVSGGAVKIQWGSITAVTSTNVVWKAAIGAVTPADADTPIEHARAAASSATSANNTTEAGRLTEASITLANLDSVAAGDYVFLCISRDAANGSDTLAEDARLFAASLEYTS